MPEDKRVVSVDPVSPDPDLIRRAGDIIQQNGVVIFPAQCLYGVAADALNTLSVEKVYQLKHRPSKKPLLVLISHKKQLADLVEDIPVPAQILMDTFWPGNLTIVFQAKKILPKTLTANTGKIGVRIPSHPVAKALVDFLNIPITGTSANLSGKKGCSSIQHLDTSIRKGSDLVLDAGSLKGGMGSTIVDVTLTPPLVLREGIVTSHKITKILENPV